MRARQRGEDGKKVDEHTQLCVKSSDIDSIKSAIRLSSYFEDCYSNIQRFMLMESIEPQKKELLDNVPALFSTTEAIQAGKEVGLSERSVMYMLVNLTTSKIIRKIKRGEYEKLQ